MALLTPLTLADCRALAAPYGVDLESARALSEGSVNSNFFWQDRAEQKYFARLYEEQDPAGAVFEATLNARLRNAGVPVARPLRRLDGDWLSQWQGKPLAVFSWIDGEWLCQGRVTEAHCRAVGRALARVHQVPVNPREITAGRFGVRELQARLAGVIAGPRQDLREPAEMVAARLRDYTARRDEELPTGLIHGDLFRDNCLWRRRFGPNDAAFVGTAAPVETARPVEIAALIDFESASHGPFVFDLMVTVLAWCYGESFLPELVRAVISGYHETRPLSAREVAAAPVEAGIACLRFATTRITDYSLRVPEGEAPGRDYRRFLARLAEIEASALAPALASVAAR